MASNKHRTNLVERHHELMPCTTCELKEICKYAFVGEIELPLNVFEVNIECKINKTISNCEWEE